MSEQARGETRNISKKFPKIYRIALHSANALPLQGSSYKQCSFIVNMGELLDHNTNYQMAVESFVVSPISAITTTYQIECNKPKSPFYDSAVGISGKSMILCNSSGSFYQPISTNTVGHILPPNQSLLNGGTIEIRLLNNGALVSDVNWSAGAATWVLTLVIWRADANDL